MLLGAVRVALRRPYTFVVLALMLVIVGPLAAMRTPTDIFPEIRMPVIAVAWQYTGLPPDQMAGRISTLFQRSLTTTGRAYATAVQSLARAISADSGTMLVQLAVNNEAGELLPGAYATVRFETAAADDSVNVPPGALILGKNGVQVATVDGANRVRLKRVTVGRDFGNVVQLAGGAGRAERIIDSPPDGIADGDLVRTAAARQQAAP
jgi:hypothetical protein